MKWNVARSDLMVGWVAIENFDRDSLGFALGYL